MKLTKLQIEQIETLTKDVLDIDLYYFIEQSEAENMDELEEELQENGAFDIEIIYYANAIKFLRENDPSLRDSLSLAYEFGFTLDHDHLHSETLASILASDMEREAFQEIREKLDDILFNK